jgi:hypothetical protein
VTPHVPPDVNAEDTQAAVSHLLTRLTHDIAGDGFVLWYLTPMALA